MLYHRFFACTPWTICHKALTIFHKSQKHHRRIVNYRITEKGDLKVFILIPCNLTISSHCTPKWSFCFCVHNPLPWAFLLNHDEMSIFQSASIYYFITEFLIWLSCFTDVLKKYLKIQLLLKMQFMSLNFHQKIGFWSDFSQICFAFSSLNNLKTMIMDFCGAIEKLKCAQSGSLSTKDQPSAAKTFKSVQWALPVTSLVNKFWKDEVGVLKFSWFVDLFTVWRLFGVLFHMFLCSGEAATCKDRIVSFVWLLGFVLFGWFFFFNFHLRKQRLKHKSSI